LGERQTEDLVVACSNQAWGIPVFSLVRICFCHEHQGISKSTEIFVPESPFPEDGTVIVISMTRIPIPLQSTMKIGIRLKQKNTMLFEHENLITIDPDRF
jgi:hypothetical protein